MNTQTQTINVRCVACARTMDIIEWHISGPTLRIDNSDAILRSITADQHGLTYRCACLMSYNIDVPMIIQTAKMAFAMNRTSIWVGDKGYFTIPNTIADNA